MAARQPSSRLLPLAGLWLALLPILVPLTAPQQQIPRFSDRVEVSRVLIDARVVDDKGRPVLGLQAGDFEARIDGKRVTVESVVWVNGEPAPGNPEEPSEATELPWASPEPPGRLIVFVFQKDLHESRIVGLMRMLVKTRDILDALGPDDRVAILSFDSHLKVWVDFTRDLERVHQVLSHGILFEKPGPVEESRFPSLVARLSQARARRAYTMEEALMLLGEALRPLPGAKSLVLVGYGFGRFLGGGLVLENDYGAARHALQASRTSVFCLDVTDADYHTLEGGLKIVASDTGGFFERTHLFSERAITRLAGALAGHYVLFLEVPGALDQRFHEVDVKLTGKKGNVLAKRHYLNGAE